MLHRRLTASHPVTAGKPFVLHPGLSPLVISVSALAAVLYSQGFKNPSVLFPAATSWSFKSAITLANVGLAQLVPSTVPALPSTTISKFTPWVLTSGYPRPLALNRPALVFPSVLRYVETAVAW